MRRRMLIAAIVALTGLAVLAPSQPGVARRGGPGPALRYALDLGKGGKVQYLPNGLPVPQLSGGVVESANEYLRETSGAAMNAKTPPATNWDSRTMGCPNVYSAPGRPNNVRATQECSHRRQAEVQVEVNPTDPRNVMVGQNDSRVGFNQTGLNWSLNGGRRWGDYTIPTRFLSCDGFGLDAYSDPAVTFDGSGKMFYTAVGFDLNAYTSGIYAWVSNAKNKGSFLHGPSSQYSATPSVVYDNCADTLMSPDKQFMAADDFKGSSAYAGNVYVTFTIFRFDSGGNYMESPIYFSKSEDRGATWSAAMEISGNNPAICIDGDYYDPTEDANNCNFDQGSWPVIGPDGTINVAYNNCNTYDQWHCQQLFVKSTDGGDTWSTPVKVADDYALQPLNLGALGHGCPYGRQCLPPNGYRMNDFPSMGINENTGKLAVFWADFRNGCNPQFGCSGTPDSNNDVFSSVSTDGGATWSPAALVEPSTTAQWQPWGDVGENGKLYVAYYDRKYGNSEDNGRNDITLAFSKDNGATWSHRRITTSSMPNLKPSNNPFQAGFLGDYMSILVVGGKVHIAWSDTRGLGGTVEEDAYYASWSAGALPPG